MKFNIQSLLEQAQKMQSEMENMKNELGNKIVTADSGSGMVTASVTGNRELVKIKIAKEIVNPDDIEMLEDLVVAAVNKALKEAATLEAGSLQGLQNMLPNIPGLNLNF